VATKQACEAELTLEKLENSAPHSTGKKGFMLYEYTDKGFSIEFPKDWKVMGGSVVWGFTDCKGEGCPSVIVNTIKYNDTPTSDQFLSRVLKMVVDNCDNYKESSSTTMTVNGLEAKQIEYTSTPKFNTTVVNSTYLLTVVAGKKYFTLECSVANSDRDKHFKTFRDIASSFKVIE